MRGIALLATLALLVPAPARAQGAEIPDAAELARTLGIEGTAEAVLLVVASQPLDSLRVGNREVDLPPGDPASGLIRLVRNQAEGIVAVTAARADRVWEGQVRAFAGRVTIVDAEQGLRSAEARVIQGGNQGFDLFGFYDALDAAEDLAGREALCSETLAGQLGDADRAVIADACQRLGDAPLDGSVSGEEGDQDLGEEPADAPDIVAASATDPAHSALYLRDGRPRVVAPGTAPRLAVAGVGAAGAGIATYSALFWEYRAEQEYVRYRDAERLGEDAAMTESLFFTRRYDRNRDVSIGVASASLTATVVALVAQGIEARRFRLRRAALGGGGGG